MHRYSQALRGIQARGKSALTDVVFVMQEDLFKVAGTPMVENCMRGYNSSMFAYGQTGSGKTYTMLGDIDDLAYRPSPQRGMTPRIFEYLFSRIQQVSDIHIERSFHFQLSPFLRISYESLMSYKFPTNL